MLIVNRHTLKSVNFLNLVDDVLSKFFYPFQAQNVVSTVWPVADCFASLHLLAIENTDVAPLWNQGFYRISTRRRNNQSALALGLFTE